MQSRRPSPRTLFWFVLRFYTSNTFLQIVGSAPEYAHGLVDPIPQLAALAKQHNVGFHTDGCLGGYVLPWVQKQGYLVQLCKLIHV